MIAKIGGLILTLVLLAAPLAATAQEAKVHRIGYLSTANPRSASFFQAFEQRLRELGYIEGRNLAIEFRNAEGRLDRLPGLAAELVRLNVNVIVTATDHATRAAKDATATIPILIVGVNFDPVALKFVTSLTRPGTNVTGLLSSSRLDGKTIRAVQGDAADRQTCCRLLRSFHGGPTEEDGRGKRDDWSQAPTARAAKSAGS